MLFGIEIDWFLHQHRYFSSAPYIYIYIYIYVWVYVRANLLIWFHFHWYSHKVFGLRSSSGIRSCLSRYERNNQTSKFFRKVIIQLSYLSLQETVSEKMKVTDKLDLFFFFVLFCFIFSAVTESNFLIFFSHFFFLFYFFPNSEQRKKNGIYVFWRNETNFPLIQSEN